MTSAEQQHWRDFHRRSNRRLPLTPAELDAALLAAYRAGMHAARAIDHHLEQQLGRPVVNSWRR